MFAEVARLAPPETREHRQIAPILRSPESTPAARKSEVGKRVWINGVPAKCT